MSNLPAALVGIVCSICSHRSGRTGRTVGTSRSATKKGGVTGRPEMMCPRANFLGPLVP